MNKMNKTSPLEMIGLRNQRVNFDYQTFFFLFDNTKQKIQSIAHIDPHERICNKSIIDKKTRSINRMYSL